MPQSARGDFHATSTEFDASLSQPTAKLLVESISRLKVAPAPHTAPGSLGHLSAAPVLDHTGPFRLVCEIASGGMATVHLAINRGVAGFEKFVAVKRIHPHLAQATEFYEMFVDEARIAALVDHPYVCRVFDFGRADQSYYIAMEFLHGEPLSKVLACAGEKNLHDPCFPHIAARVIANFAEGLHAAHSLCDVNGRNLDIIHRDVTPQNLFVLYDGTVRVTDFGIARARHRLHETHGGRLKGTLAYMAPEQLKRANIDQGVDIWSLGAVLWEMLTARKLFRCSNDGETVMDVMTHAIVAPSHYNPHVSRELDQIVLRALSRDRSERYATAAELARALEQYLTHSGDSVLAMDVAEWLSGLFPTGKERGRELFDLARAAAEEMPRFAMSDGSEDGPPTVRDSHGSLAAIALVIDEPRTETRSAPAATLPSQATPPPRLADRIIAVALAGSLVLIGVGAVGSLLRRSPLAAAPMPAPAQAASLNSLVPNDFFSSATSTRFAPMPSKIAPQTASDQLRLPPAQRLALKRTKLPPSRPSAAALPSVEPGSVFVSTPGATAQVFEAGRALGRTPQQLDLSPGPHTLLLRSDNGTRTVLVDVKPGSAAVLSLSLADNNTLATSSR